MAVTLLLAMAVQLQLPARFSLGPSWAVPAVEALLLVAIVAIDRVASTAGQRLAGRCPWRWWLCWLPTRPGLLAG